MARRDATRMSIINFLAGIVAQEILGPNERRKSFVLSPVAGPGINQTSLTAVVFKAGAGQLWQVPANVTSLYDAYVWGAGGTPGAAGVALGGGGGGGGGFASAGPQTVIPGQTFTIAVDAGGGASVTTITNPAATVIASAASGAAGAAAAGGAGGGAATGIVTETGGNGGTATSSRSASGGSAAGNAANGNNGAPFPTAAPAGGGASTLNGYGQGGTGGASANSNNNGGNGVAPGGGGGGGGSTAGLAGAGADGMAIIFYPTPINQQAISLSPRSDVAVGAGCINYIPGQTFPTVVTDADLGDQIGMPWYVISGVDQVPVQIVEFLYEPCD